MTNHPIWEKNYQNGRFNRYPFDRVVSFVLSRYGNTADRGGVKILDLGCGGGNHTRFLCTEGFDTHAVDGSPAAIELTRRFIADCGDPNKVVLGDFTRLDFSDNHFDCVIDRQSLGHNPAHTLDTIVAEVWRVLKPGGCYLGFLFSANHPHCRFGVAVNGVGDMQHFERGAFVKSGLVHFFTVHEIMERFRGFDLEDVVVHSTRSLLGPADSVHNSETLMVTAQKPTT